MLETGRANPATRSAVTADRPCDAFGAIRVTHCALRGLTHMQRHNSLRAAADAVRAVLDNGQAAARFKR